MDGKIFKEVILTEDNWHTIIKNDYIYFENISDALQKYIDDAKIIYGINQLDISKKTGIANPIIAKYKNGKRKPAFKSIILLSIAMRLTPDRSNHLLYISGFCLNNSLEHRIYKLFLNGCAFDSAYSVENCDKILSEYGFEQLKN